MTDNDDKPDTQNSGISNEPETAIQNAILTEDKTLLQSNDVKSEESNEPTHKFTSSPDQVPTNQPTDLETDPTKILLDEAQGDDSIEDMTVENTLRSNRLRFALMCLFFVLAAVSNIINLVQIFGVSSNKPEVTTELKDKRFIVSAVDPNFADQVKVGDELVSVNNELLNRSNHLIVLSRIKVGEQYTLQFKRGAELHSVQFIAQPLPLARVFAQYIGAIFLPATFFFTALAVFLLKPNDKQALLMAILFVLLSNFLQPSKIVELPVFLTFWWLVIGVITSIFPAVLLHLFLIFPKRSQLLHRFPHLEWLIYLPILSPVLKFKLDVLFREGWTQFEFPSELNALLSQINLFILALYLFAALAMLFSNYLRTDKTGKRRIRLVVAGFIFALTPVLLSFIVAYPIYLLFDVDLLDKLGEWGIIVLITPWVLMPLSLAYAIARHRVIPVSFVVRRGLQYLLAKNALRLLLILPILGIIWNITINPDRTLSEILLNNSFGFYTCIALAVVFGLLMRSRFSEWIDRRFFREQYNQERVLRELTEAVKESDSLPKLSRLVSSKIQSAMHPLSVHLFFQEDHTNDFTLSYATSEMNANLKLAAESPLLRFFTREHGAIEFPTHQTDDLPVKEKRWLRDTGVNLLVPMHGSDGKLVGIFSLGEKMSQIPYTQRDKELLETLANQIALVHENHGLKEQMRREKRIKTEVLSRFDEGNINLLKECSRCGKCFDRNDEKCTEDNSELTFSLPVERTIENRYRLEKLLGKGGMGAVYEANDLRINRKVAVKILSGAMFGNRDALRRFEREAQTAGKLNHPNIVTIFDYGVLSTEGAFLVMELVKGETLSQLLKRKGKLETETVVVWFGQVLDGLDAAHKAGIIHRDLKPDNIFVTQNDDGDVRLCILDFGLARFNEHEFADSLTMQGTVMGTLGYMSPEQLYAKKVDKRSDLFSVGVIIYEALYGQRLFTGRTYQEMLISMSREIEFEKDKSFAGFFNRCLAIEADERFTSAAEMKVNLLSRIS